MVLNGEHLQLKTLIPAMVTQKYVNWMNDFDIMRYTESRFRRYTIESVTQYVQDISGSSNDYFYGIFLGNEHIGNIKLHTDMYHKLGDIGILIGDKTKWGNGYATEAIKIVTKHGFETLELHKISAGIYANNKGSIKAFEKAGYVEDGLHKATYLYEGEYVDEIIMSKFK